MTRNTVVALTKPKHPGGRPMLYRSEHCKAIMEAMATGLSAEAAAAKVGISARSLFNWQQQHPEFLQAIQEGRQLSTLWWEERALDMAQGKPGNAMIVSLGLRNRSRAASGWHHDVQRLEHTGPDGGPIKTERPPPLDLSALPYHLREEVRTVLVAQLAKANTKLIDGSCEEV